MSSEILFERDARDKLLLGVQKLSDAVRITLGPMGKTVAICRPGNVPHLTKDGVTVANSICLKDPYENAGAALVREAAQRSASIAGDGTTTSTVLAQEIISNGDKVISAGYSSVDVLAGMKAAATKVKQSLQRTRVDINSATLRDVAVIAANGDAELGGIISKAIERVGADGAVSVQDAKGYETSLTMVEGTYIDRGFESPYFVTDTSKQVAELDSPDILIVNDDLTTVAPLVPVLERVAASGGSLLIICNSVGGEALQALVLNRVKGRLKVCVIKSPEFASARVTALSDIAVLVGATVVTDAKQAMKPEDLDEALGQVKSAKITNRTTLLFGTKQSEKVLENQKAAKSVIKSPAASPDDIKIAKRRLKRLSDGIAVIQVGGATEAEMVERRDRVDDAIHACRAALKEGVQPGGGVALSRAKKKVKKNFKTKGSFDVGAHAFLDALDSPLRQIAANCNASPDLVVQKINRIAVDHGYDGKNDKYGNMFDLGILDPHAVVVSAVEHSLSVACNLLSIGCIITEGDDNSVVSDVAYFDNA
jgi:chaperonin GroEL